MKDLASSAALLELRQEVESLRAERRQWQSFQQEIELLRAQRQQLLEQQQENARTIEQLQHQLQCLLRRFYGPSAEKIDPQQMLLFKDLLEQLAPQMPTQPAAPEPATTDPPARKGHGRRRLPADLRRHTIIHDLPEEEKHCPHCGEMRHVIGREVTEQIDYVPPQVSVLENVQLKYGCRHCEQAAAESGPQITTAEKPLSPIEKGLAAPGLLAYVIVSKYGDHLPLYRLERILDRYGINISRSTMGGWMAQSAVALHPLYDRLVHYVKLSNVIHTDDTPVDVLDPTLDHARTGRFWVYVGDALHPYTVFTYTPNRSRDGPLQFLKGWSGYLQADAFGGYDGIYAGDAGGRVIEVACWAHARRYFYEARKTDAAGSTQGLAYVRLLYDVEDEAKRQFASQTEGEEHRPLPAIRYALRQEFAVPRLASFKKWLESQQAERGGPVLPKSPMGQAITYALNQWEALCVYTTDGDLDIDNNASENANRRVALGRKNWLFCGSDNGGTTAAILFSFIASCQRHEVDPYAYLRDVLSRLPATPVSQLDQLMPDQWKAARAAEAALTPAD
jgi:transposase